MRKSLGALQIELTLLSADCTQPANDDNEPVKNENEGNGWNVVKLHAEDQLDLVMSSSVGPNVPGSSTEIGDIADYKGLILEWRMQGRPEVFQQIIYLSPEDKDIIRGHVEITDDPEDSQYPKRYTTILSDGSGTMMWLGVSLQGNRLYLSTNSKANPSTRLQRIYGIL